MTEADPPVPTTPLSPAGVARREHILRAAVAAGRWRRRRRVAARLGAAAAATAAVAVAVVLALPDRSSRSPENAAVDSPASQPDTRPAQTPPPAAATRPAERVVVTFIATDPAISDRAAIRTDDVRWIRLDGDGLLAALTTDRGGGGGIVVRDGRPEVWVPTRPHRR